MSTNIKDYSTTQASNTSLNSIDVDEGMLPSNLNNAIRALMKNTRDWFNDAQWIQYGDGDGAATVAYASGTTFTIAGVDVRTIYTVGRRVKVIAATPGTIYGTITAVAFSTNTTVTVAWDSGSLSSETIDVYIGALTADSVPKTINADRINTGVVSNAEFNYLNGVTSAIQTQLDAKNATITGSATTIDTESLTADRAVISNGSQKIAVSDVTSTELGYLEGVTSAVQTQIDSKQATLTGGATTIASSNLTASRALQSNGSGKVEVSDVTTTELGYLDGVSSAIQTQINAKQASDAQLTDIAGLTPTDSNFIVGDGSNFVTETGATARTSLGLGSIATQAANNVSISGGSITGLGTPSSSSDAATKVYVDGLVTGLKTRIICRVATTANITTATDLQAGDTIDGVTLVENDRVLVKNQSTDTQNGIYLTAASGQNAARDPEFDTVAELAGQMVITQEGSAGGDKFFLCTTNNSGSIGSVSITFTVVVPSNVGDVTLNGTQTLTNKTLTSPVINSPTGDFLKIAGTNFTGSLLLGHATTGTLSSAERNTGVGVEALDAIESGDDNTALGYLAGSAITSGANNTLIGKSSGDSLTTGGSNVGVGFYTLAALTTGSNNNVAIGRSAMKDSTGTNCDDNVAIGISALEDVTGGYNIAIGSTAGDNITSGAGNVIIGGVDAGSATGSRQLKIAGNDGSTTTTWISGDSSGNVTVAGTLTTSAGAVAASGDVTALAIALG